MPPIFVPSEFTLLLIMSLLILMTSNNYHNHYGPVLAQSDLETAADLPIFTNRPPRARLFVGKSALHHHHQQVLAPVIAASPPSPTTLAQMMRANPLLATLSMFNDNNNSDNDDISINKLETLDIRHGSRFGTETATTTVPKTVSMPSLLAKSQFKPTTAKGRSMQMAATANASSSLSDSIANFGTTKTTAPPQQQQQQQMDNFDLLYQIFNVSMFDLADQQEEKPEEVDQLPFLLPLVTRAEERRRSEASKHRSAIGNNRRLDGKFDYRSDLLELGEASDQEPAQAQQEAAMIVGVDEMLDEEDNTTMPFEITDALTNALSSPNGGIMPTTTTAMAQIVGDNNGTEPREEEDKQLTALQAQEQFPLDELRRRLKYPWERERGEHGTMPTTAPPPGVTVPPADAIVATLSSAPILASPPATALPSLPSVMPGASFYVDQHVSRGSFGRDRADSTPNLVYDPNVLQSRYGFGGLLLPAEAVPLDDNDRLVRGQQRWPPPAGATTRQRGPYAYHWPILAASAGAPAVSSVLPSAAAAVFIIPPSPRLSVARAVVPSLQGTRAEAAPPQTANGGEHLSPAEGSSAKSAVATVDKRLGFWPQQSSSSSSNGSANCGQGQQKQSVPLATTAKAVPNGAEALVPFNGNHLQWVPARVAAKGVPTSSANRRTTEEEEDNLGTNSDTGTRRWPCLADPVDLVLADSPPAVGQPIAVCFRRMRQCVLRRAPPPLQRRVGLSRVECIQFCVGHGQCSSLTYAHPSSTCELFLTRNGTGTAQLFHHREFDYFESKLGHGTALRDCWDDFLPHDGPDDYNDDDANFGPNPAPSTVKQLLVDSGDELGGQQRDTLYYSNRTTVPYPSSLTTTTQTTTTTTTMSSTTTTTPAGVAPREACASADRDIVVFKSKGYRLASPGGGGAWTGGGTETAGDGATTAQNAVLTQHSSETECSFSCLVNMANGVTPFECLAATFDSMLAQCALHGIGSSADGSIHLVPDSAFSHYEKGCILTEIVELCRGYPIIRYPQKTLLGFAIGTRRAASLLDCLELCLAHNNFNSNHHHHRQSPAPSSSSSSSSTTSMTIIWCRSVVFFYEESAISAVVGGAGDADDGSSSSVGTGGGDGQNCVLNSESGDSAPQFFVDETEALVDYASFDDCYQLGDAADADADADDASGVQGTVAAAAATATGGEKRSTAASGTDKMGMDSDAGGRAASNSRADVAESRSRPQKAIALDRKKALPKLHKLRLLPEERQQQQLHQQRLLLGHDHDEAVGLKNIGLKWPRRMGGQKIVFPSDKNVQQQQQQRKPIGAGDGQFGTNTANGRGQAPLAAATVASISGKQPPPRAAAIQLTAPVAESATAAAKHQMGKAMAVQHQRGKGGEGGQQQQIVAELSAVYSVEEEEGARKINNDNDNNDGVSGRVAAVTKGGEGGERQRHQQRQQQTMRVEGQTKMAQRQRHRWSSRSNSRRRRK